MFIWAIYFCLVIKEECFFSCLPLRYSNSVESRRPCCSEKVNNRSEDVRIVEVASMDMKKYNVLLDVWMVRIVAVGVGGI